MFFEDLATRLEILDCGDSDMFTHQELEQFENQQGFQLPNEYKDFCRIFGSGQFGNYMRVLCPRTENAKGAVNILKKSLTQFKEVQSNPPVAEKVSSMIDFCFFFGMNPNGQMFVWDLRTYQESDHSYDIYLIPLDYWDRSKLVGRSFCDFISDFCLTKEGYRKMPKYLHPLKGDIYSRFLRYPSMFTKPWAD